MTETPKRYYGFNRQHSDHRDDVYASPFLSLAPAAMPAKYDLLDLMPAVYDQGDKGECVIHSGSAMVEAVWKKEGLPLFMPSRNFWYNNCRNADSTPLSNDSGTTNRTAWSVLKRFGVCEEELWPYDDYHFDTEPTAECYTAAIKHEAVRYGQVQQNPLAMKAALLANQPIQIGFSVYTYFESTQMAKDGVLSYPKFYESMLGGHSVLVCGYDDTIPTNDGNGAFLVRNSWSANWANAGNFWMSYKYALSQLSSDFWTLFQVK